MRKNPSVDELVSRAREGDARAVARLISWVEDDAAQLHIGDDKFLERVQSYVDLAPALRKSVPDIDYVDLRFDERLYVRPAPVRK